jgi:hypothetical protein
MEDYRNLLNLLDISSLKAFVKKYMTHVKILVSKKKKEELIEHIMEHTELRDGKVFLKLGEFDIPYKVAKEKKKEEPKKEEPKEEPKEEEKKPRRKLKQGNLELIKRLLEKYKNTEPFSTTDTIIYDLYNDSDYDELRNMLKNEGSKILKINDGNIKYEVQKLDNFSGTTISITLYEKNKKDIEYRFNEEAQTKFEENERKEKEKERKEQESNKKFFESIQRDRKKNESPEKIKKDLTIEIKDLLKQIDFTKERFKEKDYLKKIKEIDNKALQVMRNILKETFIKQDMDRLFNKK